MKGMVNPIASNLLKPHVENHDFKMRPGMVTLTWTSMHIESYLEDVWKELDKLEQLVMTVNDLMENCINANLKLVSNVLLVSLSEEQELVTLEEFVDMQERHVRSTIDFLVAMSLEIENAVNDMLGTMVACEFDPHVPAVTESEIIKVKAHYNIASPLPPDEQEEANQADRIQRGAAQKRGRTQPLSSQPAKRRAVSSTVPPHSYCPEVGFQYLEGEANVPPNAVRWEDIRPRKRLRSKVGLDRVALSLARAEG